MENEVSWWEFFIVGPSASYWLDGYNTEVSFGLTTTLCSPAHHACPVFTSYVHSSQATTDLRHQYRIMELTGSRKYPLSGKSHVKMTCWFYHSKHFPSPSSPYSHASFTVNTSRRKTKGIPPCHLKSLFISTLTPAPHATSTYTQRVTQGKPSPYTCSCW